MSATDVTKTIPLPERIVVSEVDRLRSALAERLQPTDLTLDFSGVKTIDTGGAWLIVDLQARAEAQGGTLSIINASQAQQDLLDVVRANMPGDDAKPARPERFVDRVERLGRATYAAGQSLVEILGFLGKVMARMGGLVLHPRRLRLTSLVHHMQEIGLSAVPIVSLMAFLIGVVMAFQGATQLRQFGAEVFVVDLIAISILRELGILLTAIIVAGRSGAAFTAAIGSMKMREEVDAMRTLGLDPVDVLVLPRVLAIILVLPLLGFVADVMGLVGGAMMSWIELNVSPGLFRTRLYESVDVWHYAVGLIKAPFFALIIGIVGCYQGMRVGGDAESLGRLTSASVVLSIFLVIVADALFSVFFAIIGV